MVLAWVKDHTAEKKISAISLRVLPRVKNYKIWGLDYLEIGKSFCCKIWSARSHKTGNEYLIKKIGTYAKIGGPGRFLKIQSFIKF